MQIPFTYVRGFIAYINRGLMATEDRGFNSSLGNYMGTFSSQYPLIIRKINISLLDLDYNNKLNLTIFTMIETFFYINYLTY